MQLRIFSEPQQGASYERLLAVARATEAGGFDGFFRSDHYLPMGSANGLPGPTDAWITLAGLARETSRLRLGTLMSSATFRLPGPLAVAVAQVDVMSGGRIELGLGAGWYEAEHTAYGVPFPETRERFERLEEQLAIVTGLWATPVGETFDFTGRHYTLRGSPALPKPAQTPRPPVIIGGAGRSRTPRLAAAFADEFNVPFQDVAGTTAQFERARAACAAAGRDPGTLSLSAAQVICVGVTGTDVDRRAAAIGRDPALIREQGVAGIPAEAIDKLRAFAAAGATRVYLQVLDLDDLEHLALVAEEVLPVVR